MALDVLGVTNVYYETFQKLLARAASPVCLVNFFSSFKVQLKYHDCDVFVVLGNVLPTLCFGLGLCLLFWTMSFLKGLYSYLIHL